MPKVNQKKIKEKQTMKQLILTPFRPKVNMI